MDNRRESLRIPYVSTAHVIHQDTQETVKVLIRDLSRMGVGGYINCSCQRGDQFLVNLKLSTADNKILETQVMGEICWSMEIDAGGKYAFGLVFRDVELEHPRLYGFLLNLEKKYLKELEEICQVPSSAAGNK